MRCKKPVGLNSGERHSQLQRRIGLAQRTRRVVGFAVLLVYGWVLDTAVASAAQMDAVTSTSRQLQRPEQDPAQWTPARRANDTRAPAHGARPAGAMSPKPRVPAQIQTTQPNPAAPADTSNSALPHDAEPGFPALPAASRTRMRDCGHEWQEMKKTGQAKELTWRNFATQCLTR